MTIARCAPAAALGLVTVVSACASGPSSGPARETVETQVTASADVLTLRWSERHPWDTQLMAGGAMLAAEYRTRDGAVSLDCLEGPAASTPVGRDARGRAVAPGGRACLGLPGEIVGMRQDRTLHFRLPEATTATPAGPVCLLFRLPNQRVLPLRRAGEPGTETARFRYAAWEESARRTAELRLQRARVEQLRRAVDVKARDIEAQEAINARNGWSARSRCEAIQAPDLGTATPDRPVAPPAEHDGLARQVCIMRATNADARLADQSFASRLTFGVVQSPDIVDRLLGMLSPQWRTRPAIAARLNQAREFRDDWERYASRTAAYREELDRDGWEQPHFGGFGDNLSIQSITRQAAREVAAAIERDEHPDDADIAGVAGGMLEAYHRCVADGRQQLATGYRSAMELRDREPLLRERARQTLVDGCQGGVDKLDALRSEHAQLLAELRQAEAALAALGEASAPPAAPPASLNMMACRA